ncbi:MAG: methyltransferase domain-containing protein, partial [Planctomycetota bacterium]
MRAVRYVDAFDREEFGVQFPEVGSAIAGFPEVDLKLDFDKEDFALRLGKESADFIVANHVLEHLVNPLRFLERAHAVLRVGGTMFLGLPDKRRMFDRDRKRTPLADVVARYNAGESVLSEERIREYVEQVDRPEQPFVPGAPGYEVQVERHRRRSLHV